eukprot:COSAG06_NODE_668_length_13234_cov_75.848268_14_plen_128_part_00
MNRDPLLETMYIPLLSHVAAFSALGRNARGREVLALIAAQLTTTVANPGLIVMMEGEYGHEMFFVAEGEVEIYQHNSSTQTKKEEEFSDFRNGLGVSGPETPQSRCLGLQSLAAQTAVQYRFAGLML